VNGFSGGLKRLIANLAEKTGVNDRGKESGAIKILAASLSALTVCLAHWRSFRRAQKLSHFIKYDGQLYVGEEVDKLQGSLRRQSYSQKLFNLLAMKIAKRPPSFADIPF
jgi:hypothetical protein